MAAAGSFRRERETAFLWTIPLGGFLAFLASAEWFPAIGEGTSFG
jgi:hypothetical protein